MDHHLESLCAEAPDGTSKVVARTVLAVWSCITGIQLTEPLEARFLAHPLVPQLAKHSLAVLSAAGSTISRDRPLKLADWLMQIEAPSEPHAPEAVDLPDTASTSSAHPSAAAPTSRGRTANAPTPEARPRPAATRRTRTPLRSRDGLTPQRPVDWEIAKRIGPVQRYDDTF